MTVEQFLGTLDSAGVTVEALAQILTRSAVLVTIESKKAEIARKEAERQAAYDATTAELTVLTTELNALIAQSNLSL
jgi:hypothetical protein